jgi:SSS family solute:Na+ symporter
MQLSFFDLAVIGFYFVFLIGIGWFFRHFSKDSSEYFRGGGQMTWWLVGGSAFMASFSAWTFTGAASIAYEFGIVVIVIYFSNAIGFFLNYTTFAPWFRQMRVITVMQAVRQRFGKGNEQFFTWLQLPVQILYAAIWLFGMAIFAASVFNFDLKFTIILCGIVVLIIATMGGSWAVVAGDFLSALVLMPITVIAAFLALRETNGLGQLIEKTPVGNLDITGSHFTEYGMLWVIAMLIKQIFVLNNMQDASRYLCVKDGNAAKKAALLSAILFVVGPIIWFIPPMAARVLYPDLSTVFPTLKNPAEGAYVAIAIKTMPVGLLGLLITGIFSSTLSSMDVALNRNAGIFIKSVYQPLFRQHASERELVAVGKVSTIVFGLMVVAMALLYSSWENVGLFKLMVNFSALVGIPYGVPLLWCLLVKKTPAWSGWSTVLVCFLASLLVSKGPDWAWLQPTLLALHLDGWAAWAKQHDFVAAMTVNIVIGSAWFLGTRAFYNRTSAAYKEQVEGFFEQMHRPVDFAKEIGESTDNHQARALAKLCYVYAVFILLLVLIPNPMLGRLCILFCATCMGLIGWLLQRSSKPSVPLEKLEAAVAANVSESAG